MFPSYISYFFISFTEYGNYGAPPPAQGGYGGGGGGYGGGGGGYGQPPPPYGGAPPASGGYGSAPGGYDSGSQYGQAPPSYNQSGPPAVGYGGPPPAYGGGDRGGYGGSSGVYELYYVLIKLNTCLRKRLHSSFRIKRTESRLILWFHQNPLIL